jgi:hypothetical protein
MMTYSAKSVQPGLFASLIRTRRRPVIAAWESSVGSSDTFYVGAARSFDLSQFGEYDERIRE